MANLPEDTRDDRTMRRPEPMVKVTPRLTCRMCCGPVTDPEMIAMAERIAAKNGWTPTYHCSGACIRAQYIGE